MVSLEDFKDSSSTSCSCSESFAEITFAASTTESAAFVVIVVVGVVFFGVGAFVADVEFVELPHATFQFIDGIRTVGIVFVVVEGVVDGIGFGFGRTFINDNFFACDVETFTGLGTTTDGALTAVIGLGIG